MKQQRIDFETLAGELSANAAALPDLVAPLGDAEAAALVDHLKAEADRHWWINANRSLELAELIVRIGQARGDSRQIALGTMARGDALKLLDRTTEAWETLGRAGVLFQQAGDDVGWARTRIGRLLICVDLDRVTEALADAERARDILTQHAAYEKRLVLDLNTAIVFGRLSDQQRALGLFLSALDTATSLKEAGRHWLGPLHTDIGLTYEALGDLRRALSHHERARSIWSGLNEPRMVAIAETNIAIIAMKQGHYRDALHLLHRAHDLYVAENLPRDTAEVDRIIVECYIQLNRYAEARDLARRTRVAFRSFGAAYEEAITLLHLAAAEAQLLDFGAAREALDAAEPMFASLGAAAWVATTRLRRGQIALRQGDSATACREAAAAMAGFEASGQQVDFATATLLHGQALLRSGREPEAAGRGAAALEVARRHNVPALRYTAHLLLGNIAEARADAVHAMRRYRAAAATVDRVQRGLTITLRPGFLEDKSEALRALLALQLRSGATLRAFETLERAKSQALMSYLSHGEQLRWDNGDARSRALIEELNRLREEHEWLYQLAHSHAAITQPQTPDPQHALDEIAWRERRMRAITEQLYLHSGARRSPGYAAVPQCARIQQRLEEDDLLIEFYTDGATMWAFTLDRRSIQAHALAASVGAVEQLLNQLQINIASALKAGPHAHVLPGLTAMAGRIGQRLYGALLEPLAARLRGRRRLIIVPYGALHYLPFHLVHSGSAYLIEQHEVVILPAASLATRPSPSRAPGALILAHSWNGRLPHTLAEARAVQSLFGGAIHHNDTANRAALRAQPVQILHIAAHGQHRLDQPELSYIQLADGQLYADDLMQHDLSYELVTLSACETGRARIAPGDEPIGLGRGVLYSGAGAALVSLWRITDDSTVWLMERFYRALFAGGSKAQALREAQRAMLADRQPHPAFWGAFQLVGDARPLTTTFEPARQKEHRYATITAV